MVPGCWQDRAYQDVDIPRAVGLVWFSVGLMSSWCFDLLVESIPEGMGQKELCTPSSGAADHSDPEVGFGRARDHHPGQVCCPSQHMHVPVSCALPSHLQVDVWALVSKC